MSKKKAITGAVALLLAVSAIASACSTEESPANPGRTPAATATPGRTPAAVSTAAPEPTPQPSTAPTPVDTPAPTPEVVTPTLTTSQRNAIRAAEEYLDAIAFSRKELIDQLKSEGYSKADATFAVNSLTVDWNEQAYLMAQEYLDAMPFSLKGLIDQLESEGFTTEQAKYGGTKAYKE